MAIYGRRFTYNGKSSDDFGLVLCTTETTDSIPMGLSREMLKGETTSNRPVANYYNSRYTEPLSFDVTFMKRDRTRFTREEVMEINAWLTSPKAPALLSFDDCDYNLIDYFGCFTQTTNSYAVGIVVMKYTFECNAPYGWSKERNYTYHCTGSANFDCYNDTDELQEFVYPFITINSTTGASITITNNSETSDIGINDFKLTFPNESSLPLFIDTQNHKIYKVVAGKQYLITLEDLGWENNITSDDVADREIYWFRLIPGRNNITVTGKCDISFTFRVPRKVGAY